MRPLRLRDFCPLHALQALATLALFAAAAFCAAQGVPASDPLAPNGASRSDAYRDLPTSLYGSPAQTMPLAAIPAVPPPDIALVLPLEASDYARAADAVRTGFMDAAQAAGAAARVLVISHGDADVVAAFEKAHFVGARVVVGPLVRDHLKLLANANIDLPPTIALNQLDDGTPLPPLIYTLALAIESDARVVARRARDDGATNAAVIVSGAPLMTRFAGAFNGEWLLAGGREPTTFQFAATPDGLAVLRRELAGDKFDVIIIAVEGSDAALVKTFAPRVTTYASAQINQRISLGTLRDLDGVRAVDLPWLVTPDSPAFAQLPHKDLANVALDRLYALGIDAFRVADAFRGGVPTEFEMDGATGHLRLAEGRQISREGTLGVFRQGRLVPLPAGAQ
ncbi:MAG: penicillin-binding protein activator [Casimicrobiaceae bacterium]